MLKLVMKAIIVAIGALIIAIGLNLFIVPARIAPGGISGISTVVYHLTGISVGILIFALNIPIFILGFINFGKKFVLWSIFGTFALSVFAYVLDVLPFFEAITDDLLLASVFGGAMFGLGIGIVIRAGATTGGTDIVAKAIYNKFPAISMGQFILIVDVVVVAFAGLVFGEWEIILYSGIALYVSSIVIDAVVEGLDFAKMAYIISEENEKIADYILNEMKRGVTGLPGFSLYNANKARMGIAGSASPNDGHHSDQRELNKTMLMCVIKKHEINKLKNAVKIIDPGAFVVLSDVREVLGNGFKEE